MVEERERQRQAFEIYRAAGPERTYKTVADKLGVATRTVRHWSRTHRWQERIAEQEAKVAREMADRSYQEGAQETERNLKIVRMALVKLAKDIRDGRIKGVMSDVDRLIRLEEHLSGSDGKLCRDPSHSNITYLENLTLDQQKERMADLAIEMCRRWVEVRQKVLEEVSKLDHGK